MNYTENYQLNQWEQSDRVLMDDFNSDNQKIEAALKTLNTGKVQIVTGSYEGDGKTSKTITLGFQAKAVLVTSQSGIVNTTYHCYGGLALPGKPCYHNTINAIEIISSGFKVAYKDEGGTSVATNQSNTTYFYIAFR